MISLSCILKVPICLDIVNVIYQLVDRRQPYSVCKETGEYPIFLFLLVYVHDISLYMILVSCNIYKSIGYNLSIIQTIKSLQNPGVSNVLSNIYRYIPRALDDDIHCSGQFSNMWCTCLHQLLTMLASCQLKALFHCICHCRFWNGYTCAIQV